jgi:nucleoid DNA-binding protein
MRKDRNDTQREKLIAILVRDLGLDHRTARLAIRLIFHEMSEQLARGEEVNIRTFGIFRLQHWKARSRPTQTLKRPNGGTSLIPGKSRDTVRVKFCPSKELKLKTKIGYYERDKTINPPRRPSNLQGTTRPRVSKKPSDLGTPEADPGLQRENDGRDPHPAQSREDTSGG